MTSVTIKEYFAAAGTRFTDKDARLIGPVLCELSSAGDVDAAAVVQAARSEQNALHGYFEWDDAKAANIYREGQANEIINAVRVRVVAHGREHAIRAYKIAHFAPPPLLEKTAYLPREVETPSADEIFGDALRELQEWRIKYRPYAEMLGVFKDVSTVILNQISEFIDEFENSTVTAKPLEAIQDLRLWANKHGVTTGPAAQFAEQFKYMLLAVDEAEKAFDPDSSLEGPLVRENRMLREKLRALEGNSSALACDLRVHLGLTNKEADLVAALFEREQLDKRAIMATLYSPIEDDWPDQKIVDVFICKVRAKLEPRGVEIETVWGLGYRMSSVSKARLQDILQVREVAA